MTTRTLAEARPGERAIVSAVVATPARIDKLAALGILPGIEIVVAQRRPVVVVECGEMVLALEHELAAAVSIVPVPGSHR